MISQTVFWYVGFSALLNTAIALHSTVYTLYLISKGLNLFEVNLVNVVFYVTLSLFEIPTGAYADIFGRKSSLVLSAAVQAAGCLVYFSSNHIWGFMLAESILAIGVTLMSGAFDAWAVDRLKHFGHEGDLAKIFVKKARWQQFSSIVAGFAGAYLGSVYLGLPWLLSGILLIGIAILAQVVLKEEYFSRSVTSMRHGLVSMKGIAKDSFYLGLKLKPVKFLLALGLVQYASIMAYNMQWQPWFEQAFQSRQLLGWLWVGMSLAVLFGNKLVVWLREKSGGVEKALLVSQLAIALFGAITVWVPVFGLSLLSFLLHEVPRGTFRPLSDAYLHKHVPSGQRATLGSFQSMAHHAGGAVGLAVSGLVAQRFGIPAAWYVSSLTLVVGSWLVYKKYSQPA